MSEILETHRIIYNNALAERRDAWEEEQRRITFFDQSGPVFTASRKSSPFLARTGRSSANLTLRRLDKTYKAFFKRFKDGQGYPKFRRRGEFKTVDFPYGDGSKLKDRHAYFLNVGDVKAKIYRPIRGTPKQMSFTKDAYGWWAVVVCDDIPAPIPSGDKPPVGIDLGTKVLVTTSDDAAEEQQFANPKYYESAQRRLRILQRTVARRQKGSKRRKKAVQQLAKEHLYIKNQRKENHHYVSRKLIDNYGVIYHEDLDVAQMAQQRNAKQVLDAGWGQFITLLTNKAEAEGVVVAGVDPAYTSQTCSVCGEVREVSLTLRDRVFTCPSCGHSEDRDVNAAKNILGRGLRLQEPT